MALELGKDMAAGLIIGILAGMALGVVIGFLFAAQRAAEQADPLRANLADTKLQLQTALIELDGERRIAAERAGSQQATEAHLQEQLAQMKGQFSELSREALDAAGTQLLQTAELRFNQSQEKVSGRLESSEQKIGTVVEALGKELENVRTQVQQLEKSRAGAYEGLSEQIRHLLDSERTLQSETGRLVTALRTPVARGRWGELQLRRTVELAGLVEHCDFDEQVTVSGGDGTQSRPDVVIHLPGAKDVVVDAKVPLIAYLDMLEAPDEALRKEALAQHGRQLRTHISGLAKKAYWDQFASAPEFVVAFIPSESLLGSAFEADPEIFEYALSNRVLLATPVTLIALLRAVGYGWQQEKIAESAQEIQQRGRDLYDRLVTFLEHLARVGKGLDSATDAYNKAVGSLQTRLLPQGRQFAKLAMASSNDQDRLPEPSPVDRTARAIQAPEAAAWPANEDEAGTEAPAEGGRAGDTGGAP